MNTLRPAISLLFVFVILTGFLFPLLVWGAGQSIFPHQANGSLIRGTDGKPIGSELIGQNFTDPKYFHPRPSAAGAGYDAANSGATNLGPTSDKLINGIKDDPATKNVDETFSGINDLAVAYRKENGLPGNAKLPADAVTRSGSGLDPHISVANARLQARRVALIRGVGRDTIDRLIQEHVEGRFANIFGESRVNVLLLNQALDQITTR